MNKILFLVLFAISAIMFACGSQDGSPAELKNGNGTIISPFDTLVADFNSKIVNIDKLAMEENIIAQSAKLVIPGKNTDNKLYILGTHGATPGGLPYFKPGIQIDSIVFLNLENEDGYVQKRAVLRYSTHRMLDGEQNSTAETADDVDAFGNIMDGVTFVGALDSLVAATAQGNIYDTEDFFTFKLHAKDIIEIQAGTHDSLSVQFFGPGGVEKNMFVKKGNPNTIIDTIGIGHLTGSDPVNTEVPFYIKVYTDKNTSRPNPYTISILRKKGNL